MNIWYIFVCQVLFVKFPYFPSDPEIKIQLHNKTPSGVQVSCFQIPPIIALHWCHCWVQSLNIPRWAIFAALLGVFLLLGISFYFFFPWEKITFLFQNLEREREREFGSQESPSQAQPQWPNFLPLGLSYCRLHHTPAGPSANTEP